MATTIRSKGQLTIPAEIRSRCHLEDGDLVEFEVVAEGILLKPQKTIDATQAWFWDSAWQAGEREAALEIAAGDGELLESGDDLLASLERDSKTA